MSIVPGVRGFEMAKQSEEHRTREAEVLQLLDSSNEPPLPGRPEQVRAGPLRFVVRRRRYFREKPVPTGSGSGFRCSGHQHSGRRRGDLLPVASRRNGKPEIFDVDGFVRRRVDADREEGLDCFGRKVRPDSGVPSKSGHRDRTRLSE